ncbi:tetratricopeptide repeat protein [Kitasatospora sp. NBC_01266]|uniref:tetratricopeptide repeat protein n=1 Tax=Kitasatospora sp. NBC_01266 TaxID=2903572 RepID=UPI002E33489F|nr:tetratricopeptide repeat protein [Kitasatospora sp. NBC_01266]
MTPQDGTGGPGPGVSNSVTGGRIEQLVQARQVTVNFPAPQRESVTPRQIQPLRRAFVNRSVELAALTEVLTAVGHGPGPSIVAFTGLGGVGKTELIAQWAAREREQFPDGDLYADLAAIRHEGAVDLGEVLGRFLRALQVEKEYIPDTVAERGALFRSITKGRRLLVFLDNVEQPAEVRALLPGDGLVVVAGRRRLEHLALDGAQVLTVPPLTTGAGSELVRTWLGAGRGTAEEVAELVTRCGGMPLALNAVGSQLIGRRQLTVRRVMAALADRPRQDGVDDALEAVYAGLPEPARGLYHLIGVLPGARFTRELLQVVAGGPAGGAGGPDEPDEPDGMVDPADPVDPALDDLLAAHLIDELPVAGEAPEDPAEDRFGCHDLVRRHAARRAAEALGAARIAAVQHRLLDYYLHRTALADRSFGERFRLQEPPATGLLTDRAPDLDWLERESATILVLLRAAAAQGRHGAVWRLCESLWPLYHGRKLYADWIEAHELGVEAARWDARPDAEIRMRNQLARAHYELGDHELAARQLALAGELLPLVSDSRLAGMLRESQGLLCLAQGRTEAAVAMFTEAREANAGDTHGIVVQSYNLAQALLAVAGPAEPAAASEEALAAALAEADRAAELAERTDDQVMIMRLGVLRGRIHQALGDPDTAIARLTAAADLALRLGHRFKADQALELLAALAERVGDTELARTSRERIRALRDAAGVLPGEA